MKDWQSKIISRNKPFLIQNVKCSNILLAKLQEADVFSTYNVQQVGVKRTQIDKSNELIELLTTKKHGFDSLIRALCDIEGRDDATVELLCRERSQHYAGAGEPEPPVMGLLPTQSLASSIRPFIRGSAGDCSIDYSCNTLPTELQDYFVGTGTKLNVKVTQPVDSTPSKCMYSLPPKGLGYAFILNIMEVRGEPIRKGADVDAAYMTKLWEGLGFTIFPKDETFRERRFKFHKDITEELKQFKRKCIEDKADSIVIYIASHGYPNDVILTSDEKRLDIYNDFIYPFQFDNFRDKKRVAKIFINQYCQLSSSEPNSSGGGDSVKHSSNLKDTMYIKAQIPVGYLTSTCSREFKGGSYFVSLLTYVLMTKSWNTPFLKMLEEVQELLNRVGDDVCQLSPIIQMGFSDPLCFFTSNDGM